MTSSSLPTTRRAGPKRWIEPATIPDSALELHPDPVMCRLLYARGIRSDAAVIDFLDQGPRVAPDPFALPGLQDGVARLRDAIEQGETIGLYGDYDADGVCSVAILHEAIHMASRNRAAVRWRLAHRNLGYGLHREPVDALRSEGVSLLIVADCGSSDHESVAHARTSGMDVIVIDHHHMSDCGPDGALMISPYREDGLPFREMAAAGLTYLFVIGLARYAFSQPANGHPDGLESRVTTLCDLAALGTVADVVPLKDANRPLVRDGIRRMRTDPRPGVAALCQISRRDHRYLNSSDIGFQLGPRLNAAGRIDDPRLALEVLLEQDQRRAFQLADKLDRLNTQRKRETLDIVRAVESKFSDADDAVIVATGDGWRPGVLGNAASRLVDRFGKPVVLLTREGEVATGSARSVPGLHLVEALHSRADLLIRCGGHDQAAGLTLEAGNIDELRESLSGRARAALGPDPIEPIIEIAADIDHSYLTMKNARMLASLGPFGHGNQEPIFRLSGVQVEGAELMGQDRSHLRVRWKGPEGMIAAPFFSAASRLPDVHRGARNDVAATISVRYWNGPLLDVQVREVRPASGRSNRI